MTQTTKRQERIGPFKLKDVEMRFDSEGKETYDVVVYPKFRNGWSQYTREMFLWGENPKATFEALGKLPKESIVTLHIVSGKVKQNKQDDGLFESYFWNVVGIADGQQATPAPPQSGGSVQSFDAATGAPLHDKPPANVPPALGGIANESDWAGPFYHDVTDEAHQARISWGQAVNLAVETIGPFDQIQNPALQASHLIRLEAWANAIYPLIRKGPQKAPEEPLFPDAREGPQEPTDDGGEAVEPPQQALGHEHRQQKPNEPPYSYFFAVARELPHKLDPTKALQKLGVGSWPAWEQQHGAQALTEAMQKLEEA